MAQGFDLRQLAGETLVESRVADVAGHVEEPGGEGLPHVVVEGSVFRELFDGLQHFLAEGLVAHRGAGDSYHSEAGGKPAVVRQTVESGEKFTFGEVPIGAEDDDRALRHAPFKPQWILKRILDGHRTQNTMTAEEGNRWWARQGESRVPALRNPAAMLPGGELTNGV